MTNEQLVDQIRNGISVTDNMRILYETNLLLITKIVMPYCLYESLEDLQQEAYFGLWQAVQHYESSQNVLFMTYAGYWIRQAIRKYIADNGSVIRIPINKKNKVIRYKRAIDDLTKEKGSRPEDSEIALKMEISLDELQNIKSYIRDIISLDQPVSKDNDRTISDTIQSEYNLEDEVVEKVMQENEELWKIVERHTNQRENAVIQEYYINKKSLQAIADSIGVSQERVRQIKSSGIDKLKMRARREIREKLETLESNMYAKGGLAYYKNHEFTSVTEYTAIRRLEIMKNNDIDFPYTK